MVRDVVKRFWLEPDIVDFGRCSRGDPRITRTVGVCCIDVDDPMGYYAVLGVDPSAPHTELAKAYRRRSLSTHPDTNPDDPDAHEKFIQVRDAWNALGDPVARATYDDIPPRIKFRPEQGTWWTAHLQEPDDYSALYELVLTAFAPPGFDVGQLEELVVVEVSGERLALELRLTVTPTTRSRPRPAPSAAAAGATAGATAPPKGPPASAGATKASPPPRAAPASTTPGTPAAPISTREYLSALSGLTAVIMIVAILSSLVISPWAAEAFVGADGNGYSIGKGLHLVLSSSLASAFAAVAAAAAFCVLAATTDMPPAYRLTRTPHRYARRLSRSHGSTVGDVFEAASGLAFGVGFGVAVLSFIIAVLQNHGGGPPEWCWWVTPMSTAIAFASGLAVEAGERALAVLLPAGVVAVVASLAVPAGVGTAVIVAVGLVGLLAASVLTNRATI